MYVLLGFGIQGKAILKYLLAHTGDQIISCDPYKKITSDHLRWTHHDSVFSSSCYYDRDDLTIISSLPTKLNPEVAKECVRMGWNYIDLGGKLSDTEQIVKLHAMAKGKGSIVVPDCGVAPGLVSSIAGDLDRKGANYVRLYCGGLPANPQFPLCYIGAFNMEGVIKEYSGVVEFRENGELKKVPTLSARELVYINGLGCLEAEPTSGSVSLTSRYLKMPNFSYKTLRFPPHWDYVKNNVLNRPDAKEILFEMVEPMSKENPDFLVLRVESDVGLELDDGSITWRWDYDHDNEIGAMAQITGYTAAAVATMVHEESIGPGVVQMHDIDFVELKKRIKYVSSQFVEI